MQFNQRPTTMPDNNRFSGSVPLSGPVPGANRYQQLNNQDIEHLRRRTRRQFLATASGLIGGAALLVGGDVWLSSNPLAAFNKKACTTGALSTANPVKLTVGQAGKSIAFFRYYVAQQEGYFKARGLNMADPVQMPNGAQLTAALKADKLHIANGVITDAFTLSRTDSSVQIIGTLLNAYAVDIVVSNKFALETTVTTNSTLVEKVNALKGKRVGMTGPNTGTQALLTYLFRQQGLDATKVIQQVSLGSNSAAALAALKAGHVDALSYFVPFGQIAEAQKAGQIFISPLRGDIPELLGDAQAVYYTRQSIIDAQPQAIVAYIQAMSQAADFIHNNPEQTKIYLTKYLGLNASVANAVYTAALPSVTQNPQISQDAYNVAGQFHVKAGLVSVIPSYNKLVATGIIGNALGNGTVSCQS
ncbi:MAG TPA: ABC transporter substrate-binding protein [Ktedonobacteraceae bacterium]|nr:ABC transporter substrate-binding protein [Ktedonobacteraceae bacterium]